MPAISTIFSGLLARLGRHDWAVSPHLKMDCSGRPYHVETNVDCCTSAVPSDSDLRGWALGRNFSGGDDLTSPSARPCHQPMLLPTLFLQRVAASAAQALVRMIRGDSSFSRNYQPLISSLRPTPSSIPNSHRSSTRKC